MAKQEDYYGLLHIPRTASPTDIRDAYRLRSKEFHPDQFYRKIPPAIHEMLQDVFQHITDAYRILMDASQRARYDAKIGNYTNPEAARAAQAHVRKQEIFDKNYETLVQPRREKVRVIAEEAESDARAGRIQSALSKFQIALSLDPLNGSIKKRIEELKKSLP
jgi:DnaJ-class molecular chaperone